MQAKALIIFLFLFFICDQLLAQSDKDSVVTQPVSMLNFDSTKTEKLHSPKKAAWMSTVLPGLGQAYNKKYWKIPIVYAALGTVSYFWYDNNQQYQKFRTGYLARIDGDTLNDDIFPGYSAEDLRELKNYHWRYRDLNAFLFVGVWALNVLDAVVDAHLYTFDVGNNLTLRIQPGISAPMAFGRKPIYGLSMSLKF